MFFLFCTPLYFFIVLTWLDVQTNNWMIGLTPLAEWLLLNEFWKVMSIYTGLGLINAEFSEWSSWDLGRSLLRFLNDHLGTWAAHFLISWGSRALELSCAKSRGSARARQTARVRVRQTARQTVWFCVCVRARNTRCSSCVRLRPWCQK